MSRRTFGDVCLDPRESRGLTVATWHEEAREIRTENETFVLFAPTKEEANRVGTCGCCRLVGSEFAGDDPCAFCGPDEAFR